MRRTLVAAAVLLIGCLTTLTAESIVPGAEAGRTRRAILFVSPAAPVPGDLISVMSPGATGPARVDLVRSGTGVRIASAERIEARITSGPSVGAFLLGLDPNVVAGAYRIDAYDQEGELVGTRRIDVGPREFRHEDIALNNALTSLRADYDPRKEEQSRVLSELLFSRDPHAVFETGALAWPLPSDTRRTSFYGDRRTYLYSDGGEASSIHVGLDLAVPTGTPVASSGAGIVRMARERIVTGNTIVIEHVPGVYSLYYHLSSLEVSEGSIVTKGQEIGLVGMTGLATGPHLHWEVRAGGVAVDPERASSHPLLPVGLLTSPDALP